MSKMCRCFGCMEDYSDDYAACPYCGYEADTPPREAYHMIPGTVLAGRYQVGQVLGFGGFGVTYIGYDVLLDRKVAIKEYLPSEFSTRIPGHTEITAYEGERQEQFSSGMEKFLEEAKMLARFQTANGIVQIYDSFQENGTAYIVMEYLEGRTLKTYLEHKGKLSVDEAKTILHPVIAALCEIHKAGILHRDIAPDNIFLTNDGKVKLLDFGASRFATTSHSKSLSVIIKPGYAPVEQYRSRGDQGSWTDVYSLAATFYKMVTGITPEDSMERVEKDELKRPSKLGIAIPKNVDNAIMNAMNIKIEDRTANVSLFEKELYSGGVVKSRFVHLKRADVGRWPLWIRIALPLATSFVFVFIALLATGVIKFYRLLPADFILPEGMTRVPNVVNEEVDEASNVLEESKLKLQIVDKQFSEYIPQDMVLIQYQDKGKIVNEGGIVEVVVSGGHEVVYMPDVTWYDRDRAIEILNLLGITVTVEESYGDIAPGAVLSQSVEVNTRTWRGADVILMLSKGYDTYIDPAMEVTVPDFYDMSFPDAVREAKRYGLYLVKAGEEESKLKAGHVTAQSAEPGMILHQGDIIELKTSTGTVRLYMPDLQYKDEEMAVSELELLGLKATIEYEENATVARGKVLRQSVEPYDEVEAGQTVTLVVSLGTAETNAQMKNWSEWMQTLPDYVNKSNYNIESKTVYAFRDRSTTTSLSSEMEGWTQYDKKVTKGEYGPWSDWTAVVPEGLQDREINSKKQYSYRDYETKVSDQANLPGWTVESEETNYGEYASDWSAWSTEQYQESDTRQVTSQKQYRYRTRSMEYTTGSESTMAGWEYMGSSLSVGNWSDWSETTSPGVASDTYQVQYAYTVPAVTHDVTTYTYHCYYNSATPNRSGPDQSAGGIYDEIVLDYPLTGKQIYLSGGYWVTGYLYNTTGRYYFDQKTNTNTVVDTVAYDVYRVRSGSYIYTYSFKRWGNYSSWSEWSEKAANKSDTTDVESRTVYAYKDRSKTVTYHYSRWTDWSSWSDSDVSESEDWSSWGDSAANEWSKTRNVRTQTVYQYRDKQDIVTYYFYQWGAWSDWRDERLEKTDSREVRTGTLYRYCEKTS